MKKNSNLIHLLESFLLSALLAFFLFFMRRGEDAFFALTLGFSAFAFLFSMLMIYIDGDKADRGLCKLLPIARSDLAFYGMLVQFALSTIFAVWHHAYDLSISALAVGYALLPIAELLIIFIPSPKSEPLPPSATETASMKANTLEHYAVLLRKLIGKSEYESLSKVMEQTADLLSRLDPAFCVQPDALENDISNKCVKIENALLTHNASQLVLLERELSNTVELIEKRVANHTYCLKDEGFYHVDDEIAMAQIDLLLDKLGLEYEEDLPTLENPFDGEFFYRKALKFASEEYAELLASYNAQIVERLEKEAAVKVARAQKRQSALQRISHAATLVLVVAIAGVTLLWHTTIEPNGLKVSENEDGTLTVIGYNPIYGDELTIPAKISGKQITVIGQESFKGSALTTLTLPEGVTTVDYQAIRDCSALETLVLPSTLSSIGNYAFKNDTALAKVYYRGSEEEWKAVTVGNLGNEEFTALAIEYGYQG